MEFVRSMAGWCPAGPVSAVWRPVRGVGTVPACLFCDIETFTTLSDYGISLLSVTVGHRDDHDGWYFIHGPTYYIYIHL